jgi:hypothetical protein
LVPNRPFAQTNELPNTHFWFQRRDKMRLSPERTAFESLG